MDSAILKSGRDRRYSYGRVWIFSSDIETFPDANAGDIVTVYDARNRYVGEGFYNHNSKIAVRLLTNRKEEINNAFFEERIRRAVLMRKGMYKDSDCYRLISGEGDFLPGLIVDKYSNYLSVQILSAGIERIRDLVIESLKKLTGAEGIVERSDVMYRKREGLADRNGVLYGSIPDKIAIDENGIKYYVNLKEGQKTGFFLDQKENRYAIRRYSKDRSVLDVFCNTGGFLLNALHAGAREAEGIDSSESAIELARENASLNSLREKASYTAGNAFNLLRKYANEKRRYDMVILDPPAFAKGRESIDAAFSGYKEINLRAIRMLNEGGILVSCSCSHHISREDFWNIIQDAAGDARRRLRLLEYRKQASDHPIVSGIQETEYLKCVIAQVVG